MSKGSKIISSFPSWIRTHNGGYDGKVMSLFFKRRQSLNGIAMAVDENDGWGPASYGTVLEGEYYSTLL